MHTHESDHVFKKKKKKKKIHPGVCYLSVCMCVLLFVQQCNAIGVFKSGILLVTML